MAPKYMAKVYAIIRNGLTFNGFDVYIVSSLTVLSF